MSVESPFRSRLVEPTDEGIQISGPAPIEHSWNDFELQRAAERLILGRYGPPTIVINRAMEVLQAKGNLSPFMEIPQGIVSLELTRMLRESISPVVTQAVRRAIEQDLPVQTQLKVNDRDNERTVVVEVLPIRSTIPGSKCYLVVFAPWLPAITVNPERIETPREIEPSSDGDPQVERLRQDLDFEQALPADPSRRT